MTIFTIENKALDNPSDRAEIHDRPTSNPEPIIYKASQSKHQWLKLFLFIILALVVAFFFTVVISEYFWRRHQRFQSFTHKRSDMRPNFNHHDDIERPPPPHAYLNKIPSPPPKTVEDSRLIDEVEFLREIVQKLKEAQIEAQKEEEIPMDATGLTHLSFIHMQPMENSNNYPMHPSVFNRKWPPVQIDPPVFNRRFPTNRGRFFGPSDYAPDYPSFGEWDEEPIMFPDDVYEGDLEEKPSVRVVEHFQNTGENAHRPSSVITEVFGREVGDIFQRLVERLNQQQIKPQQQQPWMENPTMDGFNPRVQAMINPAAVEHWQQQQTFGQEPNRMFSMGHAIDFNPNQVGAANFRNFPMERSQFVGDQQPMAFPQPPELNPNAILPEIGAAQWNIAANPELEQPPKKNIQVWEEFSE